jgi:hypothetical protein
LSAKMVKKKALGGIWTPDLYLLGVGFLSLTLPR